MMTRRRMARPVDAPDDLQTAVEGVTCTPAKAPARFTKQDQLIALLRREQGASVTEMAESLNWLPHTTRAALTGLRKKGYEIIKAKVDAVTRYTLAPAATA